MLTFPVEGESGREGGTDDSCFLLLVGVELLLVDFLLFLLFGVDMIFLILEIFFLENIFLRYRFKEHLHFFTRTK